MFGERYPVAATPALWARPDIRSGALRIATKQEREVRVDPDTWRAKAEAENGPCGPEWEA